MTQMPNVPLPIELNPLVNSENPGVVTGEFWGIPEELLPRPEVTDDLLEYLTYLETKKLELTVSPPKAWRRLFHCSPQRPEGFAPQPVWDKDKRDVWSFENYGIVVKENHVAGIGGNEKEAHNDSLYREQMRGIWVHFPVWGITPKHRFLIMARADSIPFLSKTENPQLMQAVERYAMPYISDCSAKNFGVICRGGQRFWASVDIDFGSPPIVRR